VVGVTEFYRWWVVDPVTGERVLTPYKLTSAHAALAFPGAVPDLNTREARDLPDLSPNPWGNARPGQPWEDSKPVDPRADTMPEPAMVAKTPGLDAVALPSGLVIRVTLRTLWHRPWAAVRTGSTWQVCGHDGRDGSVRYFHDRMRRTPLQLDEADARALAKILNGVP
jgi:hypothetical protein